MVDEELLNELGRVSFPQGSAEGGHSRQPSTSQKLDEDSSIQDSSFVFQY